MAQRPKPVGGFAGGAVGYSGFPQVAVGSAETPLDFRRRQRGEGIEETGPDRTLCAVGRYELIGDSRQPNIVAHPLRHAPIGWAGLGSLTAYPTASLAGVPRHPDSPAQPILNEGAASSSRGSKEIQLCVPRAADRSCRGYGHDPETGPAVAPRLRRN